MGRRKKLLDNMVKLWYNTRIIKLKNNYDL